MASKYITLENLQTFKQNADIAYKSRSLLNTTWTLKDIITILGIDNQSSTNDSSEYYLSFTVGVNTYFKITSLYGVTGETESDAGLYFGNIKVYNYNTNTWTDDAYKTISIIGGNDVLNDELIRWFETNEKVSSGVTSLGGKTGDITLGSGLSINSSNVLSATGGGGASLTMDLLWTNQSPTSSFAAQTITTLDMSRYNYLMFIFLNTASLTNTKYIQILKYSNTGRLFYGDSKGTSVVSRNFTFNSYTSISFNNSQYKDADNNNDLIPYQIYGIK